MARRKAAGGARAAKAGRKAGRATRNVKRSSSRRAAKKKTAKRKTAGARQAASARRPKGATKRTRKSPTGRRANLDRARRTLDDVVLPTPPSSLDMDRHGSAARTGRAEMAESAEEHRTMTPAITGGDVDADVENAYFSGEEAPGGDNPTPDQDIVDDIGRSLGVEYQDNEELRASDKVAERDRHRWELDPASAEDYKERK
jgi:hypothetical protein